MPFLNTTSKIFTLTLLIICLYATPVKAQVNSVNPLTVYGLGDMSESYFAQNYGLGGASIGMRQSLYLNVSNPASYTSLEYTSLEIGISHRWIQQEIKSTNQSLTNQSTYFNYFALGFKLKEWWGMSMSISPYSTVGYNIFTDDSIADFGEVRYLYQGDGGLNQAVFGNGFEPYKNLSIGFNVKYIFGTIDREEAVLFNDPRFYNAKRLVSTKVSSFKFDLGVQYELSLRDNKYLILGATYANSANLNAKQNNVKYTYLLNASGQETAFDTASAQIDVDGAITAPTKFGIGLSYGKKNDLYNDYGWMITGDFISTSWSEYRSFNGEDDGLGNAMRASVGGYFIPRYAFAGSKRARTYFSKIEYRFGGFYENTQVKIDGNQVKNYGLTAGLGLPIGYKNLAPGEKKSTVLNLGIVVGNKGTGNDNQLSQGYVQLMFGITLGDQWFQKFKYR